MRSWGTGDDGSTGLFGHGRVQKDDLRPQAYGTIDEATSALGVAKCSGLASRTAELVEEVQQDLYYVMGEIATTDENLSKLPVLVSEEHVAKLDRYCEEIEAAITIPNQFVLPGGCMASAHLDLARTIVRRAERLAVADPEPAEGSLVVAYLNRLSDFLWAMARWQEGPEHTLSKA